MDYITLYYIITPTYRQSFPGSLSNCVERAKRGYKLKEHFPSVNVDTPQAIIYAFWHLDLSVAAFGKPLVVRS